MNPTHLHLMLTHVPVVGAFAVTGLLLWGWLRRSPDVVRAALAGTVLVALTAVPVYLSGQEAEERVEDSAWASERLIEQHEDQADRALVVIIGTGILAAAAWWQQRRGTTSRELATGAVALGLGISTLMLSWTAATGGSIRHDEIRTASAGAPAAADTRHERDDDD